MPSPYSFVLGVGGVLMVACVVHFSRDIFARQFRRRWALIPISILSIVIGVTMLVVSLLWIFTKAAVGTLSTLDRSWFYWIADYLPLILLFGSLATFVLFPLVAIYFYKTKQRGWFYLSLAGYLTVFGGIGFLYFLISGMH